MRVGRVPAGRQAFTVGSHRWPGLAAGAAPVYGTQVVKGIPLADYVSMLDERATFLGQLALRGARCGSGPSYEELVGSDANGARASPTSSGRALGGMDKLRSTGTAAASPT
jgi:cobalamin-dependent methionine synthase I